MNAIEIENLTHRFADGTLGLDGITLMIRKGDLVVIAGPNGSGKTTLLRHLNGLLLPERGSVVVAGIRVTEDVAMARRKVGMVFQDADSQIVGETVYDDAAFGPENLCLEKLEIKRRVHSALREVGMLGLSDRRPHVLSGGEKRRLAIAGVLTMEPEIIVFDEPFSSLDYHGVRQVLRQILNLHHSGRTILLATHDLEKVIAYADRLIIMNRGKIVRDGPPVDIAKDVEQFGVRTPRAIREGGEFESWMH